MKIIIPPSTIWPDNARLGQKPCHLKADKSTKLRDLKCLGWRMELNAWFSVLTLEVKLGTKATLDRWVEAYTTLGQVSDVTVSTPDFDVLVVRPLCTDYTKHTIRFHYLTPVKIRN